MLYTFIENFCISTSFFISKTGSAPWNYGEYKDKILLFQILLYVML